jgi:hypothetical protein
MRRSNFTQEASKNFTFGFLSNKVAIGAHTGSINLIFKLYKKYTTQLLIPLPKYSLSPRVQDPFLLGGINNSLVVFW